MDKNDVGAGYIPLMIGDTVQEGDQRYVDFCWIAVPRAKIGKTLARLHWPMRRKASVTLSPDSKAPEAVAGAPKPGDTAPNGLTIPETPPGFTMVPWSRARKDLGCMYLNARGGWSPPVMDDAPYNHGSDVYCFPDPLAAAVDADLSKLLPKPFTPNKYTRNLLALDGRMVPVDVYAVLAAFPTGSSSVDHAIKKLLAPGQRGHKDRLQDLKEARASLDRAIQMEEG